MLPFPLHLFIKTVFKEPKSVSSRKGFNLKKKKKKDFKRLSLLTEAALLMPTFPQNNFICLKDTGFGRT